MSDYISRQAAIDAIRASTSKYTGFMEMEMYTDDDAVEAINDVPSAQRWIPCSERLPERSGRYLVTRGLRAAGALWNRVYIVNYSDLMGLRKNRIFWQGNVGKNDFERIDDVIAWMPLPEPYKEGEA